MKTIIKTNQIKSIFKSKIGPENLNMKATKNK